MLHDLRHAVRALSKARAFTATALLSLAIGIGANTAIFSVANGLLLRPLPYRDAERLTILWNRSPGLNIAQDWFSTAQYFDIKAAHHGFEDLAIAIGHTANLTGGKVDPERIGTILVSSNLLPMLGARPLLGRLFRADEDSPGQAPAALLMYSAWERRFGRDPRVVGKSITLNGAPFVIAGVLPAGFTLPHEDLPTLYGAERSEVLLPLPLAASASTVRTHEDYNIVGKLKKGVTVAQAQAEMDTITARLRRDHPHDYPPNGGLTFGIVPMLDQVVGPVRRAVLVLLAAVGFVLLIACANVANLLLARAVGRRKEIALRTALGATRAHLVRHLLTESLLLALTGGILGVALAAVGLKWIHLFGSHSVPRLHEIALDGRALLFTVALSVCSGLIFGLAPALRTSGFALHEALKDAGRGYSARTLLVAAELALSVMLLIGAGLLIRSFAGLLHVAPGFNPRNVLTLNLTLAGGKYSDPRLTLDTYHQLWDSLEHLPGATAAGGVSVIPLGAVWAWGPITVEGRTPPPGENFLNADERVVAGHYFQAMEIPLLRGRLFDEHDIAGTERVVIADDYMAAQLWPGQDPIGKRIRSGGLDSTSPWLTVVGVVGRVKQYTLDADSRIAFYLPHAQAVNRAMDVVLRGQTEPAKLTAAVARAIHSIDPDLPLYDIRTMQGRVEDSLAPRRFSMSLLTIFAIIALALAAVGVYGVMAYLVNQGTREIGIRLALGATQQGIVKLMLRRGLSMAIPGVALGLAGAMAATRLLSSLLFGVRATDALTFAAIAGLLLVVAVAATLIPARRAGRIDPLVSLRDT